MDDIFRIVIEDNGHFQPPAGALEAGHGIRNMRSRAAKLGGNLDIETIGSGGCRIILSFPCTASP
jgi:signal transduction histidine kinase